MSPERNNAKPLFTVSSFLIRPTRVSSIPVQSIGVGTSHKVTPSAVESMSVASFVEMGFSEFLSTSVNRDGTLLGPDLKWLRQINQIKNLNVIASGGIYSIDDVNKVKEIHPFGVILGKALYENKVSIEEAKKLV